MSNVVSLNTIRTDPFTHHPSGTVMTTNPPEPTIEVTLNLEQLRLLIKSTSKTRDAELSKLSRLHAGSLKSKVKADYEILADTIVELENACDELVASMP